MKALFTIYKKDFTGMIIAIEAIEATQEKGIAWIESYIKEHGYKVLKRKGYMTIAQLKESGFQFAYDIIVK